MSFVTAHQFETWAYPQMPARATHRQARFVESHKTLAPRNTSEHDTRVNPSRRRLQRRSPVQRTTSVLRKPPLNEPSAPAAMTRLAINPASSTDRPRAFTRYVGYQNMTRYEANAEAVMINPSSHTLALESTCFHGIGGCSLPPGAAAAPCAIRSRSA